MSDTPRTDAVAYKPEEEPTPALMLMEMTIHAKTLERELSEAKKELGAIYTTSASEALAEANVANVQLLMLLDKSRANEAQLRAALRALYDLGSLELVDSRNRALRNAYDALTLPAPPVVPAKDVKPLVAVLQYIRDEADQYADGAPDASAHDKLCLELWSRIQPILTTFTAKHTLL